MTCACYYSTTCTHQLTFVCWDRKCLTRRSCAAGENGSPGEAHLCVIETLYEFMFVLWFRRYKGLVPFMRIGTTVFDWRPRILWAAYIKEYSPRFAPSCSKQKLGRNRYCCVCGFPCLLHQASALLVRMPIRTISLTGSVCGGSRRRASV